MIGRKLAQFEIKSHLGSGGMGDVYEATDSKLGRSVAIKLLPEAFARDAERVTRFEREARVLASLNHSNIAAIHGIERVDGRMFLVMEYVPGETLAERINKGRIPVDEALEIAKQICEALEAAHEKGIVHRDLKPANIKITPEGKVKVLDFGLAKAYAPRTAAAAANLSHSPTMMTNASMPGVIMGTAAYMSPEQAKGKEVDKRTDIFAFGCVLYEMLTGKRAFDGNDVTDILSAVLRVEPDWTRLPADTPAAIRNLLRLCLEKSWNDRRSDANDVRLDLDLARKEPASALSPAKQGGKMGWIAAGVATLALLSLAAVHFTEKPAIAPEMRLDIDTPASSAPLEFTLSPDGRSIVFVASGDGPQRLWLRTLDKTEAQPMAGTEGAEFPFWSPDSRSIGFFANGKLKRADIAGGLPQALANATTGGRGGTWNKDGTILFAQNVGTGLLRVAAAGGDAVPVTRLDPPRQSSHRYPQFLPDGRHFLFYVRGAVGTQGIYLGSLDGGPIQRLAAADTAAAYLAPDMVVFTRGTTLVAQHLDLKAQALTGDPATIADPVGSISVGYFGAYSTSADGRLAYRSGTGSARQFIWLDRSGKPIGTAGEPDLSRVEYPELSPDGQRLAVDRVIQNNDDIWLMDLLRGGSLTRFTFDSAVDYGPVWSPDGKEIAFSSNRKGTYDIYLKPSSGIGAEQPLIETPNTKSADDWSRDGRFLLYVEVDSQTGPDLWAKPLTGSDSRPIAIAHTAFNERNGQFSPDGKWVAYQTDESGRAEIVVQPFPEPTGKFQISTNGGMQPRWRADGKELYFIAPDGKMMASTISVSGGSIAAGTPAALFPTRLPPATGGANKQEYAVSKDGRFLLNQLTTSTDNAPITLILNWRPPK